jgi:hypothetical protein
MSILYKTNIWKQEDVPMAITSMNKLEHRIKVVRMKMQNLWNERGYTDETVLKVSIELDQLLNEYQRNYLPNSNYQKEKIG